MGSVIDNYLDVQQDILETFVDRGQLRKLSEPTVMENGKRIPGLKIDHPRQLARIQSDVLRLLASHRDPESYVAGGTPRNRATTRLF